MTRKMLIRGLVLGTLATVVGGCFYAPPPAYYGHDGGSYNYPMYYGGYYYGPSVSLGYYGGWHDHGWDHGWHHWR